jgi:hypothetical protein
MSRNCNLGNPSFSPSRQKVFPQGNKRTMHRAANLAQSEEPLPMKHTISKALRSFVALLSIFATLNALGESKPSSSKLAAQGIAQSIIIANYQFSSTAPTAKQVDQLADTLDSYIKAAKADGSLPAANAYLQSLPPVANTDRIQKAAYKVLASYGWQGTLSDVSALMSKASPSNNLLQNGLESALQKVVSDLKKAAGAMAKQELKPAHLTSAAYDYSGMQRVRLLLVSDCATLGQTAAEVVFIGAAASLGGIDPLGDFVALVGAGLGLMYAFECAE